MSEEHVYSVSVKDIAYKIVTAKFQGIDEFRVTSSKDWWSESPGGIISPQELLVSASVTCFAVNLYRAAEQVHTNFKGVEVEGLGSMAENEGIWSFDKMVLKAKITISEATDKQKIERAIQFAHQGCPIANTLKCPTLLDYEIVVE
ncbi:MAG: OsmC family protein [Candidatus Thorarchaeota archaeon]|jgi:uncharacterized OsmC-like protein